MNPNKKVNALVPVKKPLVKTMTLMEIEDKAREDYDFYKLNFGDSVLTKDTNVTPHQKKMRKIFGVRADAAYCPDCGHKVPFPNSLSCCPKCDCTPINWGAWAPLRTR